MNSIIINLTFYFSIIQADNGAGHTEHRKTSDFFEDYRRSEAKHKKNDANS